MNILTVKASAVVEGQKEEMETSFFGTPVAAHNFAKLSFRLHYGLPTSFEVHTLTLAGSKNYVGDTLKPCGNVLTLVKDL